MLNILQIFNDETIEETIEEKVEEEKKYTDKEVDEIVSKKFAKWKEKETLKIENAKKEAQRLATLSATEKQQEELDKLNSEIEMLKGIQVKYELGKQASVLLKEHKIEATDDILEFVVQDTAESTKERIEKLVNIIQSQIKLNEIERAKGTTPKNYETSSQMSEIEKRLAKYK